jgi:sugar diacid utilization regulator
VFSVVRSRGDILGTVLLSDPDRRANALDRFTLDYGATLLALELSHSRELAAAELRRRRELADDLLSGTDDESAYARGEAIGHDLRTPHSVAVLHWDNTKGRVIAKAAAQWADSSGQHCIIAGRPGFAIMLTAGEPNPADLHRAISADVGSERGSIGLGSVVAVPSELPRSFSEAHRALETKRGSPAPYGTRRFEDLGVYRILDPGDSRPEVRGFVLEWLGDLLDYDRTKQADLVNTLARYLDCGGNYDLTAGSLKVHRSTLRYRLGRIRDITGRDLKDADTRLNLHLATRVLDVIGPQGQTGSTSSGSR